MEQSVRQQAGVHFAKVPTCPSWATRIEVAREGESIVVRGWKRCETYPCPKDLPKGSDLLADYRSYADGDRQARPLHLELVDATDDQRLETFVRNFGPLGKRVDWLEIHDDDTRDLTVFQSMDDPRHKQRLFRSTFDLIVALGEMKLNARAASKIANSAMQVESFETPDPKGPSEIDELMSDITIAMHRREWAAVYTAGHAVVCRVFELFPSRLIPYPGGAVELPRRQAWSVLSEAMFMLRNDYEQKWKWSFCENQSCRRAFRLTRKDQSCCTKDCATAVRSRKYYHRQGYEVRRARLAAKKTATKSIP